MILPPDLWTSNYCSVLKIIPLKTEINYLRKWSLPVIVHLSTVVLLNYLAKVILLTYLANVILFTNLKPLSWATTERMSCDKWPVTFFVLNPIHSWVNRIWDTFQVLIDIQTCDLHNPAISYCSQWLASNFPFWIQYFARISQYSRTWMAATHWDFWNGLSYWQF